MSINNKNQNSIKKRRKHVNPLIMDAPDLQTLRQRYSYSFITFLFWVTWFYLVLPFNSLLAWIFGGHAFYKNMIQLGGWTGLMEKLQIYSVVLLVIATVFFGWAFYNKARFLNLKRRSTVLPVTNQNLSAFFNITVDDVSTCKESGRLVIDFDHSGQIVSLENTKTGIGNTKINYPESGNLLYA